MMKRFLSITSAALGVFTLAVGVLALIASPVFAASPGQLAGGDNYQVKNLTQGGAYADSVNATCNDEVQFSMQLSNTQFGALNDVTLKATLPSSGGTSTATATTHLGGESGTSDTASVTLGANQTINYEAGSTVLYDGGGNVIRTLGDGVVGGGVNIGTIEGSTTKFVNFKAKVNCKTPPEECPEGTTGTPPNCVTPPTPENPKTPEAPAPAGQAPATIAATGPEAMVSGVAGASALGYGVRRWLMSKAALKNALKLNQ